ncbi:recombinase family protein [Streptomyces sp. NPDC059851]|uniref:recombinase family protein n=1 Tax=Streptomyces sp. NPDC059851 TaxID=3346971 RepID=UPI00364B267D
MANLVYKRVSTLKGPVVFEEDGGTSSRLHPLQRPKFRAFLDYARPGDTVHISEMFRLVRGTGHILDVLDVLHRDQVALRIHDGAFSAMDLTARHPRTGELLSTVKFMVQALAAAADLQRDLQRDLTYDGLRAAEVEGSKGGRRPLSRPTRPPTRAPGTWRAAPSPPSPATTASAACHPHRHRRPPVRPHHHHGGRPRPGAAGHPRHARQGRRLPPHHRPGARRACRRVRAACRSARRSGGADRLWSTPAARAADVPRLPAPRAESAPSARRRLGAGPAS